VATIIIIKNQNRFITELNQVYRAYTSGYEVAPCESNEQYAPDMLVKVDTGPLRGMVGVVKQIKGKQHLIISVEGLGRAMVCIKSWMVSPINGITPEAPNIITG
jgi:transcription antitermination factor NusG